MVRVAVGEAEAAIDPERGHVGRIDLQVADRRSALGRESQQMATDSLGVAAATLGFGGEDVVQAGDESFDDDLAGSDELAEIEGDPTGEEVEP